MKPQVHNFSVYQGSTDAISLIWKRDGVPVDLTEYSARMQWRHSRNDTAAVAEFSTANGKIVLTSVGGITIHFDSTTTAATAAATYVHDLDLTLGTDNRTLITGDVTLGREVTRG